MFLGYVISDHGQEQESMDYGQAEGGDFTHLATFTAGDTSAADLSQLPSTLTKQARKESDDES